jgi:hypothetical protein
MLLQTGFGTKQHHTHCHGPLTTPTHSECSKLLQDLSFHRVLPSPSTLARAETSASLGQFRSFNVGLFRRGQHLGRIYTRLGGPVNHLWEIRSCLINQYCIVLLHFIAYAKSTIGRLHVSLFYATFAPIRQPKAQLQLYSSLVLRNERSPLVGDFVDLDRGWEKPP